MCRDEESGEDSRSEDKDKQGFGQNLNNSGGELDDFFHSSHEDFSNSNSVGNKQAK